MLRIRVGKLWPQGKLLSLRATYIPGAHNIGADILSRQGLRLHPEVVELIWKEFGQAQVDLFKSQETSHCPLWFSLAHPAPHGLDAMTQTWPRLRLYAFPQEYWREFAGTWSHYFLLPRGGRAEYGSQIYYPFSIIPPLELPVRRDLLSQAGGGGLNFSPPSKTMETEGAQLIDSGLSTEVVSLLQISIHEETL